MNWRYSVRLSVVLAFVLPGVASAQAGAVDAAIRDVLGGDPAVYRQVVAGFQAALRAGDARAAAAFIAYPIEVTIDGTRQPIASAEAFVADYARIVTPDIARAIAADRFGDAMVNSQGLMLGNGEAWIAGVCADAACATSEVKVITIQSATPP